MKKIILTVCIIGVISAGLLFAQGKNGVTQTAQAESTPVVAVFTAAADSGAATGESKTIKTEIQSPGVMTEYKEDGTKVVTINLSEIDENKLPEKYEAKVILEAPILPAYSGEGTLEVNGKIIAKKNENNEMDTGDKSYTPDGTFLMSSYTDGYPSDFDVKVDEKGNIYISDILNNRIQKFDSYGKHIRNIPVKKALKRKLDMEQGAWVNKSEKNEFVLSKENVFVRDKRLNKVERIDETGKVFETIEVPKEIDGRSTSEMKMWADKEGMGLGVTGKEVREGDGKWIKEKKSKAINVNEYVNRWANDKTQYVINCSSCQQKIIMVSQENIDVFGNRYFYYGTKTWGGYIKVSVVNKILAKYRTAKYWLDPEWKGDCEKVGYIGASSNEFDKNGNMYLIQKKCCPDSSCLGKIRIIKLSPVKGR